MFSADFEPADAIANAWNVVKSAAAASNAENLLNGLTLLLEPGRSIIADAGICLTSVRNLKTRPIAKSKTEDDRWLLTDAGFNVLLSMETYKWYYHLISADRAGEAHGSPYKIAGPLCDGGDVYFDHEGLGRLPDHRPLPENVRLGEVLALLNCGAYSLSQASQYNARFMPPVVLIRASGKPELIRKRDRFEDLVSNDIY
jgi:diaminopimelate decarboxylase